MMDLYANKYLCIWCAFSLRASTDRRRDFSLCDEDDDAFQDGQKSKRSDMTEPRFENGIGSPTSSDIVGTRSTWETLP